MDQKVASLINEQINKEFYSAYLYLDIANYYIYNNLDGFGNWYNIQAQEERDHALLFIKYLQNNSIKVTLEAIDKPCEEFKNFAEPLDIAFNHEKYVTSLINNIYEAAYNVKDFRTMQFLDWFIKEQGEEEANADALVNKFKIFGDDPKSLYLLNQELAGRVYAAPSLVI